MRFSFLLLLLLAVLFNGCSKKTSQEPQDTTYQQALRAVSNRQYDEALQKIMDAIAADREEANDSALAADYLALGYLYRLTGVYDSVAPAVQQAIALSRGIGSKRLERSGKIALAELYLDARMYHRAEVEAAGAATLGWLQADWRGVYTALALDARALHGLTRFAQEERVLDSLERIDSIWLEQGNHAELIRQRFLLYRDAGDEPMLRQTVDRWRAGATERRDTFSLIDGIVLWGERLQRTGERDSAGRLFAEALTLTDLLIDPPRQLHVLCDLGNLALQSNRMGDAVRFYRDALAKAHKGGYEVMEEMLRLQIIGCEWLSRRGNASDTSRLDVEVEKVRAAFQGSGVRAGEAFAHFLGGRMLERRNQPAAALKSYAAALDAYERAMVLRDPDAEPAQLADAFLSVDGSDWYDTPLALSCSVLDATGAFALNERRNLADLAAFFANLPMSAQPGAGALENVQHAYHMQRLAQHDLFTEAARGAVRNNERIQKILDQGHGTPDDTIAVPGDLPPAQRLFLATGRLDLQQVRDSLPPDAALVEYIPGPGALYSIVARRDTILVRSAPIDRGRLRALMAEYRTLATLSDSLARQSGIAQVENRLSTISAILGSVFITPLQQTLGGVTTLYVVQTPEIGWLPVHTLQQGAPAARYTVRYLSTAGMLLLPSIQPRAAVNVAGFGYAGETGWDVEYELKDIWAFFKEATMFFDTAATVKVLTGSSFDVLHLCTEFTLNMRAPGESHMKAISGGIPVLQQLVPLGAFYGMPVSPTVVFSNIAAQPGGLYRYAPAVLLANGASTVVGTMWQGDRKAKKYFGEVFYTALAAGGRPDDAYHQAMSNMTKMPEYSSPRLYGVYYLFGK